VAAARATILAAGRWTPSTSLTAALCASFRNTFAMTTCLLAFFGAMQQRLLLQKGGHSQVRTRGNFIDGSSAPCQPVSAL
jgi:hypothetical protein